MMQYPELDPSLGPNEESFYDNQMVALTVVTEIYTESSIL
jgi:hypothetical protein